MRSFFNKLITQFKGLSKGPKIIVSIIGIGFIGFVLLFTVGILGLIFETDEETAERNERTEKREEEKQKEKEEKEQEEDKSAEEKEKEEKRQAEEDKAKEKEKEEKKQAEKDKVKEKEKEKSSQDEIIKKKITALVEDEDGVKINEIKVVGNYANDSDGGYNALVHLVFDVKNRAKTAKGAINAKTDKIDSKLAGTKELENITFFWEVPYLLEDNNIVKINAEQEDSTIYRVDEWFDGRIFDN